ncbi:hypothetical protein PUMCH_003096 [Australozyma saopauloensis]|uniref:Uncharacterized protein n=1 Tax=Australozyma saopauloensis TaxID=291208 RepID=A0AAX4HBE3_9ASCO|nr:hypothetical protein PUMCH_003096 [[Candida] saopauloensis]
MLEGTRALEIGNERLDTGLIKLRPSEILFDSSKGRPMDKVAAVMNELLNSFMAWVNGLALLVTMLSCRYVYDLLENFKRNYKIEEADFINTRMHPKGYTPEDSEESQYVNIVLRGYTIGLIKVLSIFLKIAMDVLYEEEDITTRSMDLNYFCTLSVEQVEGPLDEAISYLEKKPHVPFQREALLHLMLVKNLLKLSISMNERVDLFNARETLDVSHLHESVEILDELRTYQYVSLPESLFSRFVQVDCNNRHIPTSNVTLSSTEAIDILRGIVTSIQEVLLQIPNIQNEAQLILYLQHSIGEEMAHSASAIVRGFFQLFFIRDDKSICGLDETVGSLALRSMSSLCLVANSISDVDSWHIENTSDALTVRNDCFAKVSLLFDDIDSAFYQKLSVYGNNRCRQRQLLNRNLVLWDSLQYNAEVVEMHLSEYGIGDKLIQEGVPDQPCLAISSYIYYEKLCMMTEVVLTGFEQDTYRPSEAHMMYWYASELFAHTHQHLAGRLKEINSSKLKWINNMSKKIKKAKGPKKEALRSTQKRLVEEAVPILEENLAAIEQYLVPVSMTQYYLCRAVSMSVQLLEHFVKLPDTNSSLATPEKLYSLRMKPWSSIGTPELPPYERYKESNNIPETLAKYEGEALSRMLSKIITSVETKLDTVKKSVDTVMDNFEKDEKIKARYHFDDNRYMKKWQKEVVSTCDSYLKELEACRHFTGTEKHRLRSKKGHSRLFPIYYLQEV